MPPLSLLPVEQMNARVESRPLPEHREPSHSPERPEHPHSARVPFSHVGNPGLTSGGRAKAAPHLGHCQFYQLDGCVPLSLHQMLRLNLPTIRLGHFYLEQRTVRTLPQPPDIVSLAFAREHANDLGCHAGTHSSFNASDLHGGLAGSHAGCLQKGPSACEDFAVVRLCRVSDNIDPWSS